MKKSLIVSLAVVVVVVAGGSAAVWHAYNNKYQDQAAVSTKAADKTANGSSNEKTTTPSGQTTNPSDSATPPAQTKTPAPAPAATSSHDITITSSGFSPASLIVKKGTAITWTNNDSAAHAITGSGLHSPQLKSDESYTYTFSQAGTYTYEDALVPGLSGTITVTN